MALRKNTLAQNTTLVNDGGYSKTVKPIGYDVGKTASAALSEVGKPGKGVANEATRGGALADAKGQLAGVSPSTTVRDTSERDAYLANLKAQLDAQTAAYDQLLAYNQQMYDNQQRQAAQQREDNARRAYIAKEMALKNLPGQLAREGINGGLAESSYVRLNNRYNSSLADADIEYSDAVNNAYLDMIKANRESESGKLSAQADYAAGAAKAPAAKTVEVENEAYNSARQEAYNKLRRAGYSDAMAAKILGIE